MIAEIESQLKVQINNHDPKKIFFTTHPLNSTVQSFKLGGLSIIVPMENGRVNSSRNFTESNISVQILTQAENQVYQNGNLHFQNSSKYSC